MKTKFLIFLLAAVGLLACKDKNDPSFLPPATQTGAQTFGCLIDGTLYKCSGYWDIDNWFATEGCNYYIDGDKIVIRILTKSPDSNLSIKFSNPERTTGVFTEGIEYHTRIALADTDSKFIITRFDNNILSGTFQFTIKDLNGSITKFSNGRFDIRNE